MDGKPWAMCDVAGRKINSSANATMDQSLGFNIMSVRNNKFFNGGRQSLILNIHLPKLGIISSSNPRLFFLYGEFSTKVNNDPKGIFAIDTSQYARLEITHFDTIQRIISGKFECTLKRSGSIIDTTTIKVTDGVFDAKF